MMLQPNKHILPCSVDYQVGHSHGDATRTTSHIWLAHGAGKVNVTFSALLYVDLA